MHHIARAQLRLPSFGRATFRRGGEPDLRIRLGNISRSGFMGETKVPVRAGSTVRLVVPFWRELTGYVRWLLNGRFGCPLEGTPLLLALLIAVVAL